MLYLITPVPKPRMTRSDKWKQRPAVMRYRAFADECRLKIKQDLDKASITFFIAMPKSWSKKKKAEMRGTKHRQRPDLSNLLKALEDACYTDDSTIAEYGRLLKVWADTGAIEITSDKD